MLEYIDSHITLQKADDLINFSVSYMTVTGGAWTFVLVLFSSNAGNIKMMIDICWLDIITWLQGLYDDKFISKKQIHNFAPRN